MHKINIPESVRQAVIQRRGKYHVYETLAHSKTALVVIDMQNYFMQPGMPAEMPIARNIVPNINRLARSVRAAGGKVVWIQMICTEQERSAWSPYFDGMSPARQLAVVEHLKPGAAGQYWRVGCTPRDIHSCVRRYKLRSSTRRIALRARFASEARMAS